jgi:hypothetical protein
MTVIFVTGLLVVAFLAFRAAHRAHTGVRVIVDHDRGALVIPRDDAKRPREIAIADIVAVITRPSDVAGPYTLAIAVELFSGDRIAVTPFGVDHPELLEPSRATLATALDLDS